MSPRSESHVFQTGAEHSINPLRATAGQTKGNSATSLLIKLFRDSATTMRSKPDRIMLEKGVDPMNRAETERGHLGSTTSSTQSSDMLQDGSAAPCVSSVITTAIPLTIASSKSSHYTGTEELEVRMLQVTEEGNDPFVDICESVHTDSGSSTLPLSHCGVDQAPHPPAEVSTSRENIDRFISTSNERSFRNPECEVERTGSIPRCCDKKDPDLRSPKSISAANRNRTKQDQPIPRSMLNPGHSTPTTSTMRIAASATGVIGTDGSRQIDNAMQLGEGNVGDGNTEVQPDCTVEARISENSGVHIIPEVCKTGMAEQVTVATGDDSLASTFAEQESPIIIAHNERKQRLIDGKGIAKGVQFEIARGITHGWWTWDDITDEVVDNLRGTNFEKAGKVAQTIGKGPKRGLSAPAGPIAQAIYAELDREQEAFVEHEDRGLGLKGPWKGKDNWYGGRVQLTAKLEFNKMNKIGQPPFSIRLNGFHTGKSNRAARFFTSLSILQLKFEKEALFNVENYKLVTELLGRHVVICGRLYCAFCTKEGKIFFVETNEDYQRKARESDGDQYRISFRKLVKTINPLVLNKEQSMNKWLARWQLILSTSRPVIEFEPQNIFLGLDDVYSVESDKESIMTDGCGWMNYTALQQIATITNSSFPVVAQGRIGGSKGLWLLHPAEEHRSPTEPPKIWVRQSQLKIVLPPKEKWHRSLRIFDLVRLPRLSVPSGLNEQTILNMSDNGIEDYVFADLMEAGLKAEIEPLTKWEGKNACILLAKAVEEAGRILAARRLRGASGEARLYSYVRDEDEEVDNDADNDSDLLVERDSVSGLPVSLYEHARDLLLSGFDPSQSPVLREKLKYIVKQSIKNRLEKLHIPIASSAEAFIVPDPYGVLEQGEIYFNCTTPVLDTSTCIDPHTFTGPVLVSRNPTMVPSDVRKVTAVSHDRLIKYKDVIIFSTKGGRSLASYLGGGDYDGDTATIIAEPSLVSAFHNSELVLEPITVREAFEEDIEKVSEFIEGIKSIDRQKFSREISNRVLRGLSDGKFGLYSRFHDNAAYELGYNDPETIRLAYMFTTCLDAVKSGLRIKGSVYTEDAKRWNVPRPECMQKEDERNRVCNRGEICRRLIRRRNLKPFVLDTLKIHSKNLADKALSDFEALSDKRRPSYGLREKPDEDLIRPYYEMKKFATHLQDKYDITGPLEDLQKIETFVRSLCEEYISAVVSLYGSEDKGDKSSSKSEPMAKINHEFADRFQAGPSDCDLDLPPGMVKEIKASFAHVYGMSRTKTGFGFGFAVAHDTLCALKIQAKGGSSISRECRDFSLVSSNLVRLVRID
ncbi:hypothetical protein ACEPAH_1016 [Sanghuangporus vaninii]